jgi:hypothetical protein
MNLNSEPVSLPASLSMTKKHYYSLLLVGFLTNIIVYGILPSIGTYAVLPYSQRAYYISSLILPLSSPVSVLIGLFIGSALKLISIFILFIFSAGVSLYVIIVAFFKSMSTIT